MVVALILGALLTSCGAGDANPGASTAAPAAASTPTVVATSTERTITVTGTGHVVATPDSAQGVVGVETHKPDVASAQQETDSRMEAVIAALHGQGIADDQIKTVSYTITTDRDYSSPGGPVIGYVVVHYVRFTVRPPEQLGKVTVAAVEAGANQLGEVGFALQDRSAAVSQARDLAVQDAHNRADQLARLSGAQLGQAVKIIEDSQALAATYPAASPGGYGAGPASPIEAGQLDVTVTLSITYAME